MCWCSRTTLFNGCRRKRTDLDRALPRLRPALGIGLLIAGSLALAFLVGEVLLRVTVGGPARFLYGSSFVDYQIDWRVEYGVDEKNQRKVCADGGNVNPVAKIALLGDSFVYGQGIPDCADISSLIKARLPEVRVENLALIGIGLREYQVIIRDLVDASFDRLYLLIYGNDISEHPSDLKWSGTLADNFAVFALLRKVNRARMIENFLSTREGDGESDRENGTTAFSNVESILSSDAEYFQKSVNPPEKKLEEFRLGFSKMISSVSTVLGADRITVAVVPEGASVSHTLRRFIADRGGVLPVYGQAGRVYETIRSESERLGVNFLDTFDAFLACADACYYSRDMHWNVKGSKLMAELVLEDLADSDVLSVSSR